MKNLIYTAKETGFDVSGYLKFFSEVLIAPELTPDMHKHKSPKVPLGSSVRHKTKTPMHLLNPHRPYFKS